MSRCIFKDTLPKNASNGDIVDVFVLIYEYNKAQLYLLFFSCEPVYQRSSVQVLTQFKALDSHGKTKHLLSSPEWFVDVTELVRNWLRVEDPRVASLGKHNNVIGLRAGKTTLYVSYSIVGCYK